MAITVLFFVFFVALGIQLTFIGLFLYQFLKTRTLPDEASEQPVSVIVCAHDEEPNLRELIPLLTAQDYPQFELIIVEDRCNDGTFDYLSEQTGLDPRIRVVRVRHVPEHVNGKKFGLTLGIRAARHNLILLTDADCRPKSAQWIKSMSGRFNKETEIVIGFSAYLKTKGLLNLFIRFETVLTGIQYIGLAWAGMPYMGVGRNLAYRKSLFLENKGFNNHLNITGGDDDLFVNEHATPRNTVVATGADELVYSEPKRTWKKFYYQKIRHLSVGKAYKFSTRIILGLFMGSWMLVWFLLVPVCILSPYPGILYGALALFALRWTLLSWLIQSSSRTLGDALEGWKVPFLEFIYTFYYLVAGAVALVSKKVRWTI